MQLHHQRVDRQRDHGRVEDPRRSRRRSAPATRSGPAAQALALAAIENYGEAHPVDTPDTGTLRGDLLALLTAFSKARAPFIAIAATSAFSGLLADTGLTPVQVRDKLIGDRPSPPDHVIYRRAHDRGEIDLDRIPRAVLSMPFDLVRHDLLMNLKPLRRARIESIVDELFLPLAAPSA